MTSDQTRRQARHSVRRGRTAGSGSRSRSTVIRAIIGLTIAFGVLGGTAPAAHAATVTIRLSVLKCQFSDDTTHAVPGSPLNTDAQIADFLANTGTDGIPDFFGQFPDGRVAVVTQISGWYTMPTTLAADPSIDPARRIQDCVDTA